MESFRPNWRSPVPDDCSSKTSKAAERDATGVSGQLSRGLRSGGKSESQESRNSTTKIASMILIVNG